MLLIAIFGNINLHGKKLLILMLGHKLTRLENTEQLILKFKYICACGLSMFYSKEED